MSCVGETTVAQFDTIFDIEGQNVSEFAQNEIKHFN